MYHKERLENNMEKMSNQEVYSSVVSVLKSMGATYEEYSHEALFTMEQTDEVYEGIPEQQVKVIFARAYKTKSVYDFCLIVWTGNKRVDFQKVADLQGVKKVGMASPEEVLSNLKIEIGALSPFGYANKYPVILDAELLNQPELYVNPGVHDKTIKLSSEDMLKAIQMSGSEIKETL